MFNIHICPRDCKEARPHDGYCGPSFLFQRVGSNPSTVTDFVEQYSKFQLESEPCYGRLRPVVADVRLFSKWMEICHSEHKGICNEVMYECKFDSA